MIYIVRMMYDPSPGQGWDRYPLVLSLILSGNPWTVPGSTPRTGRGVPQQDKGYPSPNRTRGIVALPQVVCLLQSHKRTVLWHVHSASGLGMRPGTMGYYTLCRTVYTTPGPGMGLDPLSPIVPVPFPVLVPLPFPCSVNVPLFLNCFTMVVRQFLVILWTQNYILKLKNPQRELLQNYTWTSPRPSCRVWRWINTAHEISNWTICTCQINCSQWGTSNGLYWFNNQYSISKIQSTSFGSK